MNIYTLCKNSVFFVLASFLCLFAFPLSAADTRDADKTFRKMVYDLISGIDNVTMVEVGHGILDKSINDDFRKVYGYKKDLKHISIAVWPFDRESLPIASEVAADINDQLYGELIKQAKGRYKFVARDSLKALIHDMEQTGALADAKRNPLPVLMEKIKNFDILINGRLRIKSNRVFVTYKATHIDGLVLASTGPHDLNIGPIQRVTVTLNQAIREAARTLSDSAPEMEKMYLGGFRFQDTGAQPPFGFRVRDLLTTAINQEINNPVSGRILKVKEMGKTDGFKKVFESEPGSYLLSGTYWVLKNEVEVQVKLLRSDEAAVSWAGRIKIEDIGSTQLYPKYDFSTLRNSDGGPISFQLSSDRGRDPLYRFGERLHFNMRVGDDAWIYCFYRQADGQLFQILPNPYFWKQQKEPKFSGNVMHKVPGKKNYPFALQISPPSGVELIKCFATSHDITNVLPQKLRGLSFEPLPKGMEFKLSEVFRKIPKTSVTETSLVVTVVK